MYGVTHVSPDWDAIGSAWLASLYFGSLDYHDWEFISQKALTDIKDEAGRKMKLARAFIVVDVGMQLDGKDNRYDHHQFAWEDQKNTCAMKLLFEELLIRGVELDYLNPLVDFITKGDTGVRTPEMVQSYTFGLHAELSLFKHKDQNDAHILQWGFEKLDTINDILIRNQEVEKEFESKVYWRSEKYPIVCLKNGGASFVRKALETCDLVIFINEEEDTNTFGIQRREGLSWKCSEIVELAIAYSLEDDIRKEIEDWYHHPSGFFSGRGTSGAKSMKPIPWHVIPYMLRLIENQYRRLT